MRRSYAPAALSPTLPPLLPAYGRGFNPALGGGVPGDPVGLWLVKDGLEDSIGESFSVMYAQLPAEHQSLYSADGITPYDNATTVANIAGYVGLNEGELIGNAEKGYAQYADGTSRYILNKGLRYFGEPIVAPTVFDRYFNTSHYTGWENYA